MKKTVLAIVSLALLTFSSLSTLESCKSNNTDVTPTSASVSALSCGSATFSASAVSGSAYTATATVPYTGGNGVSYSAGSAIASTGVTGLNATLQAGTLASAAGNLTYTISGTPSGVGTATFALSFGGQSCSLALTVSSTSSGTTTTGSSSTITAVLSTTTSTNTSCASSTGLAQVVCLAEAFKATLTATQLSTMQLDYSLTNAKRWSNLPQALYQAKRVGINLGSLSSTQLAAFRDLMLIVLAQGVTNEGYDEMVGNLVADDYLATIGGGSDYGAGNFYVAFLGTPSTTGQWELQFGGHHYTFANTYNSGALTGFTPSFRAVEPMAAVTSNNRTYQPVEQERAAIASVLTGLSSTELITAKLSSTFSDILLGPGVDWQFPTTKQGLRVGDLSTNKQALVSNVIKLYVNDLDATTAASVLATYTTGLADTYIAYSGTTAMTTTNDYFRIDGPRVWIEYSSQGGIIIRNTPHPHSVWRDRTGDYGGNK